MPPAGLLCIVRARLRGARDGNMCTRLTSRRTPGLRCNMCVRSPPIPQAVAPAVLAVIGAAVLIAALALPRDSTPTPARVTPTARPAEHQPRDQASLRV
jgi:hypothetical protein